METAKIKDIETGEHFTLSQMEEEYNRLKNSGETEAENFKDYIENITGKNGTCVYIEL